MAGKAFAAGRAMKLSVISSQILLQFYFGKKRFFMHEHYHLERNDAPNLKTILYAGT